MKSENVYVINIFRYNIYRQMYSKTPINSDISNTVKNGSDLLPS